MPITIRQLTPDDRTAFRAIRREALQIAESSFLMTLAEEDKAERLHLEDALDRPDDGNFLLGAFDGDALVGIVAILTAGLTKLRHLARLGSMFVTQSRQHQGIGRRLVDAAVRRAFSTDRLRAIKLDIVVGNVAAESLYRSSGFVPYGREPQGLRLGSKTWDLDLLILVRP